MAAAQPPQNEGPEEPCAPVDSQRQHQEAHRFADRAVARREEGVQNMAAIELADGQQGHGGGEHPRSEEHTSELQSLRHLVCRLLLEKKEHISTPPVTYPSRLRPAAGRLHCLLL